MHDVTNSAETMGMPQSGKTTQEQPMMVEMLGKKVLEIESHMTNMRDKITFIEGMVNGLVEKKH